MSSRGKVPLPPDDERRVEAVRELQLLDTSDEARFDELIEELSRTLDAPIAYLALIDAERQWLKAKVGPIDRQVDRDDAFCSHVILGDEPVVVADATEDPRFAASPLTTGGPNLRFYAGVPIADETTGQTIGTVCVADQRKRELTARELAILRGFASRIASEVNAHPRALVAYAVQDLDWVQRLVRSGEELTRRGLFDLWSGLRAATGEDRDWKLKDAVYRARAVIVFLSPAFLATDFVRRDAFRLLLDVRGAEGVQVIPVLLEPCAWEELEWLRAPPRSPSKEGLAAASARASERFLSELAAEIAPMLTPADGVGSPRREGDRARAAPAPAASPRSKLFLSHASEDGAAARELAQHLRAAGLDVWLDEEELPPGAVWMDAIEKAIEASDAFAVYVGRVGVERWISREVRVALDRNVRDPRYRVIPILGPGADPEALPSFLAQHHWLDLREERRDPDRIRRLVGSLLDCSTESVSLLGRGETPFRGLLAFDVEHAHLFFGRDRETEELLAQVRATPFLGVIGESGSGKSSLVRAGLVPALHGGRFASAESWLTAVTRPGKRPFQSLASALADLVSDADPARRLEVRTGCAELLATGTDGLGGCVGGLVPAGGHTLLVVDQFEELFTLVEDPRERDRFIDTLLAGSDNPADRPVHVVFTLRADFYSHCFAHPRLAEVVAANQYPVRQIDRSRLAEVIEKPAAMAGVRLEPGLVEIILHDLGEESASLALLEHTLLELWNLRSEATLTLAAYESIGRVQGALEHHAEKVYGALDGARREIVRRLLLNLAVPGKGDAVTRRQIARRELAPAGGPAAGATEEVLQHLIEQRLLAVRSGAGNREDGEEEGDEEVEVAHEALLRGWQRFRGWLQEDREFLLWRLRTRSAYEAWEESGRDHGALLRGAPLAEARRWLERRAEDLGEDGRAFIAESIGRHRRGRRLRGAITLTVAVLALVAVLLALFAQGQRRQADANFEVATLALSEVGEIAEIGGQARAVGSAKAQLPETVELKRNIAERAIAFYEKVSRRESFSADLMLEEAVARYRLGNILAVQSDPGAEEAFGAAVDRLEELARRYPGDPRYRRELANARYWHADARRIAGDAEAAERGYRQALAIQRELVADPPEGSVPARLSIELGRTLNGLGIAQRRQSGWEEARGSYEEARSSFEKAIETLPTSDSGDTGRHARQGLAWTLTNLAELYEAWGWAEDGEDDEKFLVAEEFARAAIAVLEELRQWRRELQVELAVTHNNLANLLIGLGRWREAETESARAVGLLEELTVPLPYLQSELGTAYISRAYLLSEGLGARDQARDYYRRAHGIFDGLVNDPQAETLPRYRYRLALALSGLAGTGDRQAAAELCRLLPELTEDQRDVFAGDCAD